MDEPVDESADRIYLRDLTVACRIGARREERKVPQEIRIDVCLFTDLRPAGASDRLQDTVDYGVLGERIVTLAEGSSFKLLERLAEEVARECLSTARVERVEVTVSKPHALRRGSGAAVRIARERLS